MSEQVSERHADQTSEAQGSETPGDHLDDAEAMAEAMAIAAAERHAYFAECGRRGGLSRSKKKKASFAENRNKKGRPVIAEPSDMTRWKRESRARLREVEEERRRKYEEWEKNERELQIGKW